MGPYTRGAGLYFASTLRSARTIEAAFGGLLEMTDLTGFLAEEDRARHRAFGAAEARWIALGGAGRGRPNLREVLP